MKRERSRKGRWLPLLLMLLLGLLAMPVGEGLASPRATTTTPLNTIVYLTEETLQPLFQEQINSKVPLAADQSITDMLANVPEQSKGWSSQMANALIQPAATITDMTTQQDGIATTVQVSLYPGDPFPVESRMLITFSKLDDSTIQVSSEPISGATLISGPLTTMKVPMGKLQDVYSTPDCGKCALALELQIDVELDDSAPPAASSNSAQLARQSFSTGNYADPIEASIYSQLSAQASTVDVYVEVSQASLDKLASGIDRLPVSQTMKAQNLRIKIQNGQLVLTADLSPWDTGIALASTTTYIKPATTNGIFHFQVERTDISVAFITFDGSSYNQQIETLLNTNLLGALGTDFTVTDGKLNDTTLVPCASQPALILTGKTTIE